MRQRWNRKSRLVALVLLCVSSVVSALGGEKESAGKKVYQLSDFGGVGDGIALETGALQAAIDACHEGGGGKVWIPRGRYQIGTVVLKSGVTLSLAFEAELIGSQKMKDYPTAQLRPAREGNAHCLFYAEDAKDIRIEGLGVIDGRGSAEAFPRGKKGQRNSRPRLIRMENCERVSFAGVTYKNPAFWGIHLVDCREVHFSAVTVLFRNNNYNNDGLDLDGCENVLIENCAISAGDDAICLKSSLNPCRNIEVRDCRVDSNTAALKFGTSSKGGFIDIKVSNCYFHDCPMGAIKLQCVDGGILENVEISRIVMEDVGCPIFIRLGNRGRNFLRKGEGSEPSKDDQPVERAVGIVRNIRIKDVVAKVRYEDRVKAAEARYKGLKVDLEKPLTETERAKAGPIMIAGIPGHFVENVLLENVKISYPGLGRKEDREREVPEDVARYPEQFFFGVLPAWGAYLRHAKDIQFKNVKLDAREEDARERIVLDDVEGFLDE